MHFWCCQPRHVQQRTTLQAPALPVVVANTHVTRVCRRLDFHRFSWLWLCMASMRMQNEVGRTRIRALVPTVCARSDGEENLNVSRACICLVEALLWQFRGCPFGAFMWEVLTSVSEFPVGRFDRQVRPFLPGGGVDSFGFCAS